MARSRPQYLTGGRAPTTGPGAAQLQEMEAALRQAQIKEETGWGIETGVSGFNQGALDSITAVSKQLYLTPVTVSSFPMRLVYAKTHCTVASSGNSAHLGIYVADGFKKLRLLPHSHVDLPVDTTGHKGATLTEPVFLEAGKLYFLSFSAGGGGFSGYLEHKGAAAGTYGVSLFPHYHTTNVVHPPGELLLSDLTKDYMTNNNGIPAVAYFTAKGKELLV